MNQYLASFFILLIILLPFKAQALDKKTICTWDPVGNNGPIMTFYADLKPKAITWGLDLEFRSFTDEVEAYEEFKAGNCNGAHLSSILSRQFVPFAGTLDAIGGIMSDDGLNQTLATLAKNKKVASLLTKGEYEVVASFPVGSVYAFVNNRKINNFENFYGKTLSVLNEDPQAFKLSMVAGASPVGTTLDNFANEFNNGNIDIILMPALAYNTFELYHGLGDEGGIIDHRFYFGMLQTVINKSSFPADFGDRMRHYVLSRLPDIHKLVDDAEKEIPKKYWIKTSEDSKRELDHFSKEIRLALKSEGVMDAKALKLLWAIRCKGDPERLECANPE